jgi:hypothetical protein
MGKFAVAAGSIRYAVMVIGLTLAAIVAFSISVYEIHRDPCGVFLDRDGCLEFFRKKPLYENVKLDAGLFYASSRAEGLKLRIPMKSPGHSEMMPPMDSDMMSPRARALAGC